MKKKLVLLVTLVMIFVPALAACGSGGEGGDVAKSKYVGVWKTDEVIILDESESLVGEVTLTLNPDGTGTMADDNETSEFTWELTADGFKTKGDVNLDFSDDGNDIKAKVLGVELIFSRSDEQAEEPAGSIDGKVYGYGGDDPVEAACYEYMVETVAKQYDAADVSIPNVNIVNVDYTPEDEILAAGDFWVFNYNIDGDTLKCVSGGNYPGVMHISKDGYKVTEFEEVTDGEDFEVSAKALFGDDYDAFMDVYSDDTAREENRKFTIKDYVSYNGLEITKYQDEGWDPVELPQ